MCSKWDDKIENECVCVFACEKNRWRLSGQIKVAKSRTRVRYWIYDMGQREYMVRIGSVICQPLVRSCARSTHSQNAFDWVYTNPFRSIWNGRARTNDTFSLHICARTHTHKHTFTCHSTFFSVNILRVHLKIFTVCNLRTAAAYCSFAYSADSFRIRLVWKCLRLSNFVASFSLSFSQEPFLRSQLYLQFSKCMFCCYRYCRPPSHSIIMLQVLRSIVMRLIHILVMHNYINIYVQHIYTQVELIWLHSKQK